MSEEKKEIHSLYKEFCEADRRWQEALVEKFGPQEARFARYEPQVNGELRELREAFLAASRAYHAACRGSYPKTL